MYKYAVVAILTASICFPLAHNIARNEYGERLAQLNLLEPLDVSQHKVFIRCKVGETGYREMIDKGCFDQVYMNSAFNTPYTDPWCAKTYKHIRTEVLNVRSNYR